MPPVHSIRAVAAALTLGAAVASGQPVPTTVGPGAVNLTIFVRGVPIGSEQVSVTRVADGWTITSVGRIAAPIDAVARRIEVRYTADWRPRELTFDGVLRGVPQSVRTVVDGTTATSDVKTGTQTTQKSDTIDANAALVLPNTFFGPFEAVAVRLRNAEPGAEIPIYGVPAAAFSARVGETTTHQIQTTARMIAARRTRLTLMLPGAMLDVDIWMDESGRMIRFSAPAQSLEVVREDIASVSARTVTISRPNDERITVAAAGFTLAGTLSKPVEPATTRRPAVVLVGGSGPADRDGTAYGVPILGEVAGALADAGFLVLRYDKRGIGQSGGRVETASLAEYAEDVRAAAKALADRKDVDSKRIAVVGYSDGAAIALIAASKEKRIAAVGVLAATGAPGADILLAQQEHLLNRMKLSPEERQAKIDLQKRIHDAVLTGRGWDQVPVNVRQQVDNPEFQSILANDPARVMPGVRQPLLIVHGELDSQVTPTNADKLEALARKRKNQPPVEVVKIPRVNHLLVPASTGEVDEYGTLTDKHVSQDVTQALVAWLKKTL